MADLLRRPQPATLGLGSWEGPAAGDPRPDAVLFDMDGALFDTGTIWAGVVGAMVRSYGGVWRPEDGAAVLGWSVPALAAEIARRGVPLPSDEVAERLDAGVAAVLRRGLPWRPGGQTLLVALRRAGVPCALVTATHASIVEGIVAQAPEGVFGAVVTGDGTARPKPAPDGYLEAADRLRVDAERCAAVEDSPTGVRAALGSGALTYAVDPTVALPADLVASPRLRRVDGLAAVGRAVLATTGW